MVNLAQEVDLKVPSYEPVVSLIEANSRASSVKASEASISSLVGTRTCIKSVGNVSNICFSFCEVTSRLREEVESEKLV